MTTPAEKTLRRQALTLRILWMLLFVPAWYLAELALLLVVLAQLGWRLLKGEPKPCLQATGDSLSQYLQQIGRFASFSSERKPWPFSDWPQSSRHCPEQQDEAGQ